MGLRDVGIGNTKLYVRFISTKQRIAEQRKKYEDSRLDGTWKNTGKGLRSYIGLSLKTVEVDVQISMN